MKTLIAILLCSLLLSSCAGDLASEGILEGQGYTNIEIGGVNLFACSEDDIFRYNFTATNPYGKQVKGVVCSAPLKGYTIRFFP